MKLYKFPLVAGVVVLLLGIAVAKPVPGQDSARHVIRSVEPVRSEIASAMKLSGVVRLEVHVLASGSVRDIKVLGGHPLLAEAAKNAVGNWRWESGKDELIIVVIRF